MVSESMKGPEVESSTDDVGDTSEDGEKKEGDKKEGEEKKKKRKRRKKKAEEGDGEGESQGETSEEEAGTNFTKLGCVRFP